MRFDVVLALLVSTTWAMPEPLLRGTSDRWLHAFYVCREQHIILTASNGACWYALKKTSSFMKHSTFMKAFALLALALTGEMVYSQSNISLRKIKFPYAKL